MLSKRASPNFWPTSSRLAGAKGLLNEVAIAQSLPRYDLESLNLPTLVFSVEDDLYKTYTGARYTAEHIRGARFLSFPTGGHLNVGHQAEVWSEAQKFLETAAKATRS